MPLKQVFYGTPVLDVMRSKSLEQLSSIILIFKPGTELMAAQQAVAEAWRSHAKAAGLGRNTFHAATAFLCRLHDENRDLFSKPSFRRVINQS